MLVCLLLVSNKRKTAEPRKLKICEATNVTRPRKG